MITGLTTAFIALMYNLDLLKAKFMPAWEWHTGKEILKVHKHEIFYNTFFAETESLWSQGPVTRDF